MTDGETAVVGRQAMRIFGSLTDNRATPKAVPPAACAWTGIAPSNFCDVVTVFNLRTRDIADVELLVRRRGQAVALRAFTRDEVADLMKWPTYEYAAGRHGAIVDPLPPPNSRRLFIANDQESMGMARS